MVEADVDVPRVRPGRVQKGVGLQVVFVSRRSRQTASAHMRRVGLLFQKELVLMWSRVGTRAMRRYKEELIAVARKMTCNS